MKVLLALSLLILACLAKNDDGIIDMDFFVMTRCPDAKACELEFLPLIQKDFLGHVTPNFHFIADVSAGTETGFDCMHGQRECKGDLLQLCTDSLYSKNSTMNFIQCMDRSQKVIPMNGKMCAGVNHLDYDAIEDCATSETGHDLMAKSIAYTKNKGIRACCTMRLNDKPFCVHNGDWQDCKCKEGEDKGACFIRTICQELSPYERSGVPACKQY
eukprot:TRINITY_DN782024_c0_g1_i1.p1 TRINITY_DN782024_c0_g1~~TRINITY_DN782024_c0_g1_i1.p1  ORF type:complete len:215 (+),score=44.27 TRINITY_DN782024_c0_g1_i1:37-681(+)